MEFDGKDDRVDLGTFDVTGKEMSISFWFKADTFNEPEARLISKAAGTGSNDHYWMVGTYNNSSLRFRLKTNGRTTTLVSSANVITIGKWHHVSVTYDGVKMRIYNDGQLVGSTSKTGNIDTNNSIPVALGNQPANAGSRPFDGLIDDVKIYGSSLVILTTEPIPEEPAPVPPVQASGTGSITLNWVAPVARVDGTPLAATEISKYTIHYGTTEGIYSDSFTAADFETSVTITGLQPGTNYYVAITTLDTDGLESGYYVISSNQAQ